MVIKINTLNEFVTTANFITGEASCRIFRRSRLTLISKLLREKSRG